MKKFFKKIINLFLISLGIIFIIGGLGLLLNGDIIFGFVSIIVGISFLPYIYNKIRSFLIGKEFFKKIFNNYGKIYFFIFFIIFILGVSISNNNEEFIQ